jgi:ThiF family
MNDELLLRYSRQIMLPEIDAAGQSRLADAHVAIIGLGGLGSAASIYLAAGGVGRLSLADFDKVDLSNLQRQIVHHTADIGRLKVESARDHLLELNPGVNLELIAHAPTPDELEALVRRVDVVIDASDNFDTRIQFRHPRVSLLPLPVHRGCRHGAELHGKRCDRSVARHHRQHAGAGGDEADHGHRRGTRRAAVAVRRAGLGVAHSETEQGPGLPDLRTGRDQ